MPTYVYRCPHHGEFEEIRKMIDASDKSFCPICGTIARRVYFPVPDVWHCDGAHKTDYGRGFQAETGDKRERLNRKLSKLWNEEPPEPAADVPKNSGEKY